MIHKKAAFSLVELIISVVLLGIIVTFLYSTVSTLQQTNKIFSHNEQLLSKKEKVIELLYDDLFSANNLQLRGFDYSLASMQTTNSIYDIAQPYVTWLVSKEGNTLLRFESIKKFENINSQNNYYYHISKVGENCDIFKIYQSKKKDHILIHLQFKNEEPIIYEFAKPLFVKEVNSSKKKVQPKVTAVEKQPIKTK
jgi:prepilin-type N-terminal cleavage/methylation domain-containing protein